MLELGNVLYLGAIGLVLIGIWGIVKSRHVVRIILAIGLLEAGANLLLIVFGYRPDAAAPIVVEGVVPVGTAMVDPIPQALVLTAIVIGVGVLAVALSLALRVQRAYGTLDLRDLRHRLENDLADAAGVALPGSAEAPVISPPVSQGRPLYKEPRS